MIPKDPVILLGYINTELRDHYGDLEALCDGLDIGKAELDEITQKLAGIDYHYDKAQNKFI